MPNTSKLAQDVNKLLKKGLSLADAESELVKQGHKTSAVKKALKGANTGKAKEILEPKSKRKSVDKKTKKDFKQSEEAEALELEEFMPEPKYTKRFKDTSVAGDVVDVHKKLEQGKDISPEELSLYEQYRKSALEKKALAEGAGGGAKPQPIDSSVPSYPKSNKKIEFGTLEKKSGPKSKSKAGEIFSLEKTKKSGDMVGTQDDIMVAVQRGKAKKPTDKAPSATPDSVKTDLSGLKQEGEGFNTAVTRLENYLTNPKEVENSMDVIESMAQTLPQKRKVSKLKKGLIAAGLLIPGGSVALKNDFSEEGLTEKPYLSKTEEEQEEVDEALSPIKEEEPTSITTPDEEPTDIGEEPPAPIEPAKIEGPKLIGPKEVKSLESYIDKQGWEPEDRTEYKAMLEDYKARADQIKKQIDDIQEKYGAQAEEIRNTNEWLGVIEKLGNAFTMLGAGLYGKSTGAFPEGIKLSETDWAAKTKNQLASIDQVYGDFQNMLADKYDVNIKGMEATQKSLDKVAERDEKERARAERRGVAEWKAALTTAREEADVHNRKMELQWREANDREREKLSQEARQKLEQQKLANRLAMEQLKDKASQLGYKQRKEIANTIPKIEQVVTALDKGEDEKALGFLIAYGFTREQAGKYIDNWDDGPGVLWWDDTEKNQESIRTAIESKRLERIDNLIGRYSGVDTSLDDVLESEDVTIPAPASEQREAISVDALP